MMKNIFKGFIIGVGKIVPGVSGSMLAISMGVYERALKIISNVRKCSWKDFVFLLMLVIGVFIGISVFSKGVKWLLGTCYLPTMLLFVGLIIGTFPDIIKEMSFDKKNIIVNIRYITIFVLSFCFSYFITKLGAGTFDIEGIIFKDGGILNGNVFSIISNIIIFFMIGFIEAFSSIVPGISGTAIFMSLGCYELLLSFYENIFNPSYFLFGISFFAGVIVGIVFLARIITFLFRNYKCATYWAIFGFMVSSIVVMIGLAFMPGDANVYAYGHVTLSSFIDFNSSYFQSLIHLLFCILFVIIGYYCGTKINLLMEKD